MSDRTIMKLSMGSAGLVVAIVIIASCIMRYPLPWLIETGLFVPIVAGAFLGRLLLGGLTLLHPERPRTGIFKAAFEKDQWLIDRLRSRHRRSLLALGAWKAVMMLAAILLFIAAVATLVFDLPGASQACNSFVILAWVAMTARWTGSALLLLPEALRSISAWRSAVR